MPLLFTAGSPESTRDNSGNGCSYTIYPNNFATPGTATFDIAFTSDGGHSRTETISVEIGPDSNIRFTAPPTFGSNRLRIGKNLTLAIDALDYVNENAAYTVTCGDAAGVDSTRLTAVSHTGSSCDFTIDPVDSLATSLQGNTSFTITYTSDGGATATGRITVNIGPDSSITFTPPTGLKIGRNFTLVIDALEHLAEDDAYTVSCADATGVDATKMTVTRSSSGKQVFFHC